MAIFKIISHGKNNRAKREVLRYVLNPQKTTEELCHVTGDYQKDEITPKNVYQEFQRIRKMFDKDKKENSRTYTHGTVSFPKGEVTPEEVKDFTCELMERIYPEYQVLTAVHTDREHLHAHFVVECCSYISGKMLHTSKHDLDKVKKICNDMAKERGLHVPEKGKHYDGTDLNGGDIVSWNNEKYQLLVRNPKKSYLVKLLGAIKESAEKAKDKNEFCEMMKNEFGWDVIWKENRKNITFVDGEGHRVRDSTLFKSFSLPINKEWLEQEIVNRVIKNRESSRKTKNRAGRKR